MLNRRDLLFFAPALIPSVNLMGLSWRSSKLLTRPISNLSAPIVFMDGHGDFITYYPDGRIEIEHYKWFDMPPDVSG